MKHLLVVVLLLFTSSVFAQDGIHNNHHNNVAIGAGGQGGAGGIGYGGAGGKATAIAIGAANAVSKSSSKSNSYSSSNAQQQQGQIQGQQQGQVLRNQNRSSSNNNGGNVAITDLHRKNLRNAPSFGLPAAFPTAVCQGTAAAGFSFWLGGGAVAGTITIEECMKLETIRVGTIMLQNAVTSDAALAQEAANIQVFCLTKYGSLTGLCGGNGNTAAADIEPAAKVVSVVEPVKVAGIPDVTHEPEVKRAKIWFFGL